MKNSYNDFVTLLGVYIYTKEKIDPFEIGLLHPTDSTKNGIYELMCDNDKLGIIPDKKDKINNSYEYLTQFIINGKFSEEKFYKNSIPNFELDENIKNDIVEAVLLVANEDKIFSSEEKDVGKQIAHFLDNSGYFNILIDKLEKDNKKIELESYNKNRYYEIFSLASIYIILKDYYEDYEEVILNPHPELFINLEKLFLEIEVLQPIMDKPIVIRNSIKILRGCIDNKIMIENRFFEYMKPLELNLNIVEKEIFLKHILHILSIDRIISEKEQIFMLKLSDSIDYSKRRSKKLMENYKVQKAYRFRRLLSGLLKGGNKV